MFAERTYAGDMSKKAVFSTYLENMSKARTCGPVWPIPILFTGLRGTFVPRDEGERRRPLQNRPAVDRRAEEAQGRVEQDSHHEEHEGHEVGAGFKPALFSFLSFIAALVSERSHHVESAINHGTQ